jgi:hypothetical protein
VTEPVVTHKLAVKQKVLVVNGRGKKYDVEGEVVRLCQTKTSAFYLVRFPGLVSLYSFGENELRAV